MTEKITGLESLLSENNKFTNWCEDLANELLQEKILSKETLGLIIANKIKRSESDFYECLCTELHEKIEVVKRKSAHAFKNRSKKEYTELGFILSALNNKLKAYNIERTKAYQRNEYKLLKDYLIGHGLIDTVKEFKASVAKINKIQS